MGNPMIEGNHIAKRYGKKQVLKDASFFANAGECIGIVGENGCGKTTLLQILSGVITPSEGTLQVDGENPYRKKSIFRKNIGFVPQENPLMPELSCMDNLRFWYGGASKRLDNDLMQGVPAMLGIGEFVYQKAGTLSGGQKKRLSIACALANAPRILVLDEPGAALDIVCKQQIIQFLKQYVEQGNTVILASHETAELELCHRKYWLHEGMMQPMERMPKEALPQWMN